MSAAFNELLRCACAFMPGARHRADWFHEAELEVAVLNVLDAGERWPWHANRLLWDAEDVVAGRQRVISAATINGAIAAMTGRQVT